MASISFSLLSSSAYKPKFTPRLGQLTFRHGQAPSQTLDTPGFIATTSRGVVSHLSRDHLHNTASVQWIHVPFESFLENTPPVLTKTQGDNPMHSFLGFSAEKHLVSLSIRDSSDCSDIPPNGKDFVSARCVQGVRKVTLRDWKSYAEACKPDIVFAMSDTMLSTPPYSQKCITKSIERSCAWLLDILAPVSTVPPNVFVHLAGGSSVPAREAFSRTLTEKVYGKEAELVHPLECLDDGVSGYVFDLAPMRSQADGRPSVAEENGEGKSVIDLCQASLDPLPASKIRLANSAVTPHEVLRLIAGAGVDMFDSHWAQRAADIGIGLNFTFPPPSHPPVQASKRQDLGLNLYHNTYTHDFSTLNGEDGPKCPCLTCSPSPPSTFLSHAPLDTATFAGPDSDFPAPKGFSRAYIHHLLHTHEMSAHTLLVLHNLAVLDQFFADVRRVLGSDEGKFCEAVASFCAYYDDELAVFQEARVMWDMVDKARGKGRLTRDKPDVVDV